MKHLAAFLCFIIALASHAKSPGHPAGETWTKADYKEAAKLTEMRRQFVLEQKRIDSLPPAPLSSFVDLLRMDRTCSGLTRVHRELDEYQRLLRSTDATADQVNQKIDSLRTWISQVARNQNDSCRISVLSLYLVESLYILTRHVSDIHGGEDDSAKPIRAPLSAAWVFYAVAALNQGHVVFTDGTNLEIESGDKHHSILGSYACEKLLITLNPAQAPLNLAATMSHELFHVFYDRFSGANVTRKAKLNRYSILLEETQASLLAAFLQREFANVDVSARLRESKLHDLTFFSSSGPLDRFAHSIQDDSESYRYRFEQMLATAFFTGPDQAKWQRCVYPDFYSSLKCTMVSHRAFLTPLRADSLYDLIGENYFGVPLTARERQMMSPTGLKNVFGDSGVGTTRGYAARDYFPIRWAIYWWAAAKPEALRQMAAPETPLFEIGMDYALDDSSSDHGLGIGVPSEFELWKSGREGFKGFSSRDPYAPSKLCEAFHSLVRSGALVNYLGRKVDEKKATPEKPKDEKPSSGGDGGRPSGGDGGRPSGGDGGRPSGGDGGRPTEGGDGGRPTEGGDGGRPTTSGVRPCVNLEGQL